MSLAVGSRLGPYEVIAPLGAGGMGQVYRARDTRLGRTVAVKILTDHLADSPAARQRFEQEARAVAALAHPNIVALHDVGQEGEVVFAVTELLEGETLQDRLQRGPLPLRKLIEIGTALADGLAAAHAKGIVHRDLKPSNVFLTSDGRVKLLDFGLAKQRAPVSREGLEASPTVSQTEPGTVLGTVGYMSPEQVRGQAADARSDIFALGCVLYEMATGERAFARESAAETLAAIVTEEPQHLEESGPLPPELRRLVARCLEKNPDERFQSARDLAFGLRDPRLGSPRERSEPHPWRVRVAITLLSLVAAAALFVAWRLARPSTVSAPLRSEAMVTQLTSYAGTEGSGTLSPDGKYFAFVSERGGMPDIWIRQVSGGDPLPLTRDDAEEGDLVYSPDGESIYFTRRDPEGSSIYRVAALGGQPSKVLAQARLPGPSPDGKTLAYARGGRDSSVAIEVRALDGSGARKIATARAPARPVWSPDGRWLAYSQGGLFEAQNLFVVDVRSGIARQVTHFDRASAGVESQSWLPDSRRLVVSYNPSGRQASFDLGIVSLDSGAVSRLTMSLGNSLAEPSVSADGSRVLVTLSRLVRDVWKVPLGPDPDQNGRAAVRLVDSLLDPMWIHGSRDGRTLLFNSAATGSRNLWIMPTDASQAPRQITAFAGSVVMHSSLSPDGTKVAFASSQTGNSEIWVQNVDGSGLRQLTDDAAPDFWPIWSPDGQALAFGSIRGGSMNTWLLSLSEPARPAELLMPGTFRGDWIRSPTGAGTRIVSTLAGDGLFGGGGVRLMDVERRTAIRDVRVSGDSLALPVFSPDGRFFSLPLRESRTRDAIWIFDVETGQGRVVARLPGRSHIFFRAAWTDNGKALIVNRYESVSHIAMIDGL